MNAKIRDLKVVSVISSIAFFFGCQAVFGQLTGIEIENKVPQKAPLKIEFKNQDSLDWVHNLEVKVTNTGEKPIYCLFLILTIKDLTAEDGAPWGFSLFFGDDDFYSNTRVANQNDLSVLPHETYVFKVGASAANAWKNNVDKGLFPSKVNASLDLGWLSFGDFTGYNKRGILVKKKPKK